MELTVLGCYGPYPHINGACSGYLVKSKESQIVLDLGNGTLRNLFAKTVPEDIDAIVLSHLHPDHCSDMLVFRYALDAKKISLDTYAPDDPSMMLDMIRYKDVFHFHDINSTDTAQIGDMKLSFQKMKHAIPSYAVKIETDEVSFVYSGDTGLNGDLIRFALGADVLMCESAVSNDDYDRQQFHMSAAQGCETAIQTGCKTLILTHFYPEYPMDQYQQEVADFKDDIKIYFAEENKNYLLLRDR